MLYDSWYYCIVKSYIYSTTSLCDLQGPMLGVGLISKNEAVILLRKKYSSTRFTTMITFSMQIKKISSLFTHLELKLIKRALQGLWRDIFPACM